MFLDCGFFAEMESVWNRQNNQGYVVELPGDDFWQFNLYAGHRFFHRRAEVRLGILNLGNQNYRLNPLNLHDEYPRERTFFASVRLLF
jgi:outer membrane receptor protein involved in Fe transport